MHRDEIAVYRHDIGNQHPRGRPLLIALQRRRPLHGHGFLAGDIQEESSILSLECKRSFASVGVEMDTYRHPFRQNQMDQSEWVRQRMWKILPGTDALIEKPQFEKSQIRQTDKLSHVGEEDALPSSVRRAA